jgi:hypothetical protein
MKKRLKISDSVYLKTGSNKEERIITAIAKRHNAVLYELTYGIESSWHYSFEFTIEKPRTTTIRGLK